MTEQNRSIAELQTSGVAKPKEQRPPVSMSFFDLDGFELMQRIARVFATSSLVPQQYQGNLPNCIIALDMAQRMHANPMQVMQNLYIVHGMPGWSAKFLIATVNTCGRYSSLRYEWKGDPGTDDYGCRAWAVERETGQRLDGIWVTWKMVKAEGWASKKGSKWLTMEDQMFIYRASSFWQRAYAPELSMGLMTEDEIHDTYDAKRGKNGDFTVELNELRETEKVFLKDSKQEEPAIIEDAEHEPIDDGAEETTQAEDQAQAESTGVVLE